jgi:hypothetical protein
MNSHTFIATFLFCALMLKPAFSQVCTCPVGPAFLDVQFTGGDCSSTTNFSNLVLCSDFVVPIPDATELEIVCFDAEGGAITFVDAVVGESFRIPDSGFLDPGQVVGCSVFDNSRDPAIVYQRVVFSTGCADPFELSVGDIFGAFTVSSFQCPRTPAPTAAPTKMSMGMSMGMNMGM